MATIDERYDFIGEFHQGIAILSAFHLPVRIPLLHGSLRCMAGTVNRQNRSESTELHRSQIHHQPPAVPCIVIILTFTQFYL